MKKHISCRSFINATLLLSSLALLSGCTDWLKDKMGCASCGHADTRNTGAPAGDATQSATTMQAGEVLLELDGKPAVTTADYERYLKDFEEENPQVKQFIELMPNAREEVFKQQVSEKLIDRLFTDNKIAQNVEIQEKMRRQKELAERRVKLEWFQTEVLKSIDTSDDAVEKFYNENKTKHNAFRRPPFVKHAEGLNIHAVQFSDEKAAKEFLEKVQQPDANFDAVAKADKKQIKKLTRVNAQSQNVDKAIKDKAAELEPGQKALVSAGKNKYFVIYADSRTPEEFAPFEEVKDAAKQIALELQFFEAVNKKLEELKQKYNAQENTVPFEKERERKAADFQEQIKKMQEEEARSQANQAQQVDAEQATDNKSVAEQEKQLAQSVQQAA